MVDVIDREYLVEIARECGVELYGNKAVVACREAITVFFDKLLLKSLCVAQHYRRTVLHEADIAYALRVVAALGSSSLGVFYSAARPSNVVADISVTGSSSTPIEEAHRQRASTESELCDAGESTDSSYTASDPDSSEQSSVSSGDGGGFEDEFHEEYYAEMELAEIEQEPMSDAKLVVSVFNKEGTNLELHVCTSDRMSYWIRTCAEADSGHFPTAPLVNAFNQKHGLEIEFEEAAYSIVGDILKQQLELSLSGKPSMILAHISSVEMSLLAALMLFSKANVSAASSTAHIETPADSADTSGISASTISSKSAPLSDEAHHRVAFRPDNSEIPGLDLSFSSAGDVSAAKSEPDADRSIGITPYFSRRKGAEDNSVEASPQRMITSKFGDTSSTMATFGSHAASPSGEAHHRVAFRPDDSVIPDPDQSFSSVGDVSAAKSEPDADRSIGITPYFSRRKGAEDNSVEASQQRMLHSSAENSAADDSELEIGTPYLKAYLSKRGEDQKRAHESLWMEGGDTTTVPPFLSFDQLSPIVARSPSPTQRKRQKLP